MPTVQIELTDQEYARLLEAREKRLSALPQAAQDAPPTFEQWLAEALSCIGTGAENADEELSSVRAFTTMENMVFSLHKHGFVLAHTGKKQQAQPAQQAQELAQDIVNDMQLQPQYVKRVQDLLGHFMKTARDLVEAANIGLTSRGQAALNETYRLLVERTEKAVEHLGGERAIGRVEGGAAILAGLDVMDRDTAKKKTDEFKIKVRTGARFK